MLLPTNISNLIGRIIMIFCCCGLIYLFIHFGLSDIKPKAKYLLYFLVLLNAYLFFTLIYSFLGIMKVEVDFAANKIEFLRMFSKTIISKEDIIGYYTSYNRSRRKTFYGVALKVTNNRTIDLNEFNLKFISRFEKYLEDNGISLLGDKRFYFPLKPRV